MPIERIIASLVVVLVAFLDYIGIINPVVQKPQSPKQAVEYNVKSDAVVNILGEIGKFGMNETVKIKCEVKNTGTKKYTFPVGVEISGTDFKQALPFKKSFLDPGKSEILTFEFKVPQNAKEGIYSAVITVWDHIEGVVPVGKFSDSEKTFELVDMPPQLQFLNLGLSANIGEKLNIKVRAKDDRGVRTVKVFYQLPGSTQTEALMKRTFGNERDGVWEFVTNPSSQTGRLIFLVEATDTKSQVARTEEYKIAIVGKK